MQREPLKSRRLWAALSATFRTESYFAFVGAGTAGMLPIVFRVADEYGSMDVMALFFLLLIAVPCLAVASTISLNAWRSSIPMAYTETFQ